MQGDKVRELLGELPGWSEVYAVWLDVEEGKAVINIFMLPGPRTGFAVEFMVLGTCSSSLSGTGRKEPL
jgi:hypothetical protein